MQKNLTLIHLIPYLNLIHMKQKQLLLLSLLISFFLFTSFYVQNTPAPATVKTDRIARQNDLKKKPLHLVANTKAEPALSPFCRTGISVPLGKASATGDGTLLYGFVSAFQMEKGIYSFPAASGSAFTPVAAIPRSGVRAALQTNDGKFYIFATALDEMYNEIATCYIYNNQTWELEGQLDGLEENSIPAAMAYDAVSGTAYAIVNSPDDYYGVALASYNLLTCHALVIGDIQYMAALACDAQGILYGIGSDGQFYRIDTQNANVSPVGSLGAPVSEFIQSAAFDTQTGKLYWAASYEYDESCLYEIDPANGHASLISQLPGYAEVKGLYIPAPLAADQAPAKVTDMQIRYFSPDGMQAEISFYTPATSYGGDRLTGPVDVAIAVDGKFAAAQSDVQPGEKVTKTLTLTPGSHHITAICSNEYGSGPEAELHTWTGPDVPEAVGTPTAILQKDNEIVITWTAPRQGVNGGYLDTDALTYEITRNPGNVLLTGNLKKTAWTDVSLPAGQLEKYTYTITPAVPAGKGTPAATPPVLAGPPLQIPYTETFPTEARFNLWTVVNETPGTETWTYDHTEGAAVYNYDSEHSGDDWLISPPLALSTENIYRVNFQVKTQAYPKESFKVTLGSSVEPSAHSILKEYQDISERDTWADYEVTLSVAADGIYYLGFYECSAADRLKLSIRQITVTVNSTADVPGAVTGFTAIADAEGAGSVQLSFTTPDKSYNGAPLTQPLTSVCIYRNGSAAPVKTFDNPDRGIRLDWTDTDVPAGENRYSVIAFNESGAGRLAETTVFVGNDTPGAVMHITVNEVENRLLLHWDAPTGVNNGYIDPASLTYTLIRRMNDQSVTLTESLTATSYSDGPFDLNVTPQQLVTYTLIPHSSTGSGEAKAHTCLIGKPYETPFAESFRNQQLSTSPWSTVRLKGTKAAWNLGAVGYEPDAVPQDEDGGLAWFNSALVPAGETARLLSPAIDISGLTRPELTFYMYHYPVPLLDRDTVKIECSADNGEYRLFEGAAFGINHTQIGWVRHRIPLDLYKSAHKISIGFRGISEYGYNLFIDNIRIEQGYDHDLAVTSFKAPAVLAAGERGWFVLTVLNKGSENIDRADYTVRLLRDGEEVCTAEGVNLSEGRSAKINLYATPSHKDAGKNFTFSAEIIYTADEYPGNNQTETVHAFVPKSALPAVTTLDGTVNDNRVTLTWNEPVPASDPSEPGEKTTDPMESYEPFIIDGIGGYTLSDLDGLPTFYPENTKDYPNKRSPMAFQVFRPAEVIDMTSEYNYIWEPCSGEQFLACFSADGGPNDDWIISPLLSGNPQIVSFQAKSVTDSYGLERYQLLYSLTGNDPNDFIPLHTEPYREAPVAWTEITTALPYGARYFAIRCVSDNAFAFLIDDIVYTPGNGIPGAVSPTGYNIYRDEIKINDTPVTERIYIDRPVGNDHIYYVTAVYDSGESDYSNEFKMNPLALNEQLSKIAVISGPGYILLTGAAGRAVALVSATGQTLCRITGRSTERFAVDAGLYLLVVGETVTKVVVP